MPLVLLAVMLASACGSENLIPPARPDQADLYWDLELNHHAVVLSTTAPFETLQLTATPRNYRAEPLAGLPVARYTSTDPERVIVSQGGLLIAVAPTSQPVAVVATLTANNLKSSDTVMVSVVDAPTPPVLDKFSIHPVPPDSAKISAENNAFSPPADTLPVFATTATGEAIPVYRQDIGGYLPVAFRSSDSSVARFRSGPAPVLGGVRPGTVNIYASTTAFGVTKADTLIYRVGWPLLGAADIRPAGPADQVTSSASTRLTLVEPEVVIGVGGAVTWNVLDWFFAPPTPPDTIEFVFATADIPNVGAFRPAYEVLQKLNKVAVDFWFCQFDCDNGGNITLTGETPLIARHFPVPGTYEYHSSKYGLNGRVIVVDER